MSVVTDTSQFLLRGTVLRRHNFFVSVTTDTYLWLRIHSLKHSLRSPRPPTKTDYYPLAPR